MLYICISMYFTNVIFLYIYSFYFIQFFVYLSTFMKLTRFLFYVPHIQCISFYGKEIGLILKSKTYAWCYIFTGKKYFKYCLVFRYVLFINFVAF
jgi:hypothetical protein